MKSFMVIDEDEDQVRSAVKLVIAFRPDILRNS